MKKNKFKLLKKLNKADYFFVCLIVILGVALFLFFIRKPIYVNIRVKVTDSDVLYTWSSPKPSYAERFIVGDVEKDGLGRPLAKITNVERYHINEVQKVVYLDLSVRATYDKRSGFYYAKGKPLIYGSAIKFNFGQVLFEGIVTEIPDAYRRSFYNREIYEVTALVKALNYDDSESGVQTHSIIEPEIIKQLRVGQVVRSSNGSSLVEIMKVETRPSVRVITNDVGGIYKVNDPYYRDAILTLRVQARIFDDEIYILDDIPLKSNISVPLVLDDISIKPLIISFKEQGS